MKNYGQFCPLAQAARVLCERWTIIIIREFIAGSTRFSELQYGLPQISPSLLSTRLKELERMNIIKRKHNQTKTYQLTEAGQELRPIVELFGAWGHRWVRSDLRDSDLDAGLLMWDMRRTINPDVFPSHQVVVQFRYPDAPQGARDWWLISKQGEIDLCKESPNLDVDVLVTCSLRTMTSVWICDAQFDDLVKQHKIEVSGDPSLTVHLQDWICSSLLSRLGTQQAIPSLAWA